MEVTTTGPIVGRKRVTPVASLLAPAAGRTFADSTDAVVRSWIGRLDTDPVVARVAGEVAGLDLFDADRILRARVFLFLPQHELGPDAYARLVDAVSESSAAERIAARLGHIDGTLYHDRNGTCFLGVDDQGAAGAVIWVVADDRDDVRIAIDAFRGSTLAG